MKVYLVWMYDSFYCREILFGVFSTKELARKHKPHRSKVRIQEAKVEE